MPRDAAGGIIAGKDGRIVLVWQNSNSWSFPKGGVDAGESPLQTAWREIREETGLSAPELKLVEELGAYKRYAIGVDGTGENRERPPGLRTLYLFRTEKSELHPQESDVTEARWVTVEEALKMLTHPKDAQFLESVRKKVEAAVK